MKKIVLFRNDASPDDPIMGYDRIERRYITMSECLFVESAMQDSPDVPVGFDRIERRPNKSGDICRVVDGKCYRV
jgi:hypothetical protein